MDFEGASVGPPQEVIHQAGAGAELGAGAEPDTGHEPGDLGGSNGYTASADATASNQPVKGSGLVDGSGPAASDGSVSSDGSAASEESAFSNGAASRAAPSLDFPHKASPVHGPGRWLRVLTGVDEDLLDRVWEERARYTGLGAIVLGTAIMAMLSMLDALDQAFGPVWPALLVVALFWGAFICGIDRWLISSTHGVRGSRWRIFLPRIGLAILFGIIIAAPLVLTVFGSEIVTEAKNHQEAAVTTYESQLKACNPIPGQPSPAAALSINCNGLRISVNDPAVGTASTLGLEKAQRIQLTSTISTDNKTIARLNLTAREECNGTQGLGLSGLVGQGPNCHRDRQEADAFASQSNVSQLETQLATLNQNINSQTLTAGAQTQAYATAITTAIAKLVATKKADEGRIGLLNRIDALGALAAISPVIAGATVLLGLFIVIVDCLPVLSKMMSGTTRYDEVFEGRLKTAGNIATAGLKVSERQATGRDEIALQTIESEVRARLEKIDDASRVDKANRDAELDRKIAELAAEFRKLADEEDA